MKKKKGCFKIIQGFGRDEEARQLWKKLCGYHRRSLAETAMYRFIRSFGGDFPSRKLAYQQAELYAKSLAMNKRTKLEMPKAMGANLCDISLEELLDHLRNKA
ncbi:MULTISPECIES: hypothetical protein [unclassified Neochlamydia]|uniref:hypothetical protein n=1 Tax=unclassified Neochlamydia TaxID=2643326 RepID=UPI0006936441|nr:MULTISPECIES: hypothetical protein [unclassified Neochlamydia]BBI16428.1 Transposase IS4 family protein [Neochlamydia sp. S13]